MRPRRRLVIALVGLACLASGTLAAAQPATEVFAFEIVDGNLTAAQDALRVTEGDRIELHWTSDEPVELHLHGYNKTVHVAPGAPGVMAFEAYATGRYPVTTHGQDGGHNHAALLYLEVHPR